MPCFRNFTTLPVSWNGLTVTCITVAYGDTPTCIESFLIGIQFAPLYELLLFFKKKAKEPRRRGSLYLCIWFVMFAVVFFLVHSSLLLFNRFSSYTYLVWKHSFASCAIMHLHCCTCTHAVYINVVDTAQCVQRVIVERGRDGGKERTLYMGLVSHHINAFYFFLFTYWLM